MSRQGFSQKAQLVFLSLPTKQLYESRLPVASCSALNKGLLLPSLWGERPV